MLYIPHYTGDKISDIGFAMLILGSLPTSYETVSLVLQSMDAEELTYSTISARLLIEERRQASQYQVEKNETALFASYRRNNGYNSKKKRYKFKGNCDYCGIRGHKYAQCRKRKRDQSKRNSNHNRHYNGRRDYEDSKENETLLMATDITDAFNGGWFVDSGASAHMSGEIQWFSRIHEIPERFIRIPDGVEYLCMVLSL